MKVYYKVWSGLTKFIRSQCEKGRCVDFPLVGRFMKRIISGTESGEDKYFFVPQIDFVESGKYSFPENDFNISPLSKLLPVSINRLKYTESNLMIILQNLPSAIPVSASAIASVTDVNRDTVMSILKEIFVKFVSILTLLLNDHFNLD